MKKLFWVTSILLVLAIIGMSCTSEPAPEETTPPADTTTPEETPAEETTTPTENITTEQPSVRGTISGVDVAESTITVQTADGPITYQVGPDTELLLGGEVCSLELLDTLIQEGALTESECTIIPDTTDESLAAYVDITNPPDTYVQGATISSVNATASSITVQTAEGPKTYQVGPDSILLIGGEACSLELLDALAREGALDEADCTVISDVNDEGQAIYIDITNPPESYEQGSGTLTAVDSSTVTIETDTGPRTFEVDPVTGMFLDGKVCSIYEIEDQHYQEGELPCEVLYYTDDEGNLIYIDITSHEGQ